MRKILVPIDGSDSSANALEYILGRKKAGEKLTVKVLYVQPTPLVMNKEIEQLMNDDRKKVFSSRRIASTMKKLGANPMIGSGDPALNIIKVAASEGSNEIVMGTRGRGRIAQVLLGSVASKVVQLAAVPVVLVK